MLLLQGNDLVQVTTQCHSYDHHLEVVFEQACFSAVREGRQEHEQDSACDFEFFFQCKKGNSKTNLELVSLRGAGGLATFTPAFLSL